MEAVNDSVDGLVVIPGDDVTSHISDTNVKAHIKVGPGLQSDGKLKMWVSKSGILRHKTPDTYWVDCHQKRYVPCKGENVVGVVTARQGDFYKVDIGASDQAVLNNLSFEGASKRYRPNVAVGDVLFCKVIVANKDMEPEITCVDPSNNKANGMGILSGDGFLFSVSLNLVRKLLSPNCVLLPELGARHPFEITVGLNGKIVLFCKSAKMLIAIKNVIVASEYMTNQQMLHAINSVF